MYVLLTMAAAIQELPWLEDGLSLTERLTLSLLAEGSCPGHQLFYRLTNQRDPLPFLGDTMYWFILDQLLNTPSPPLGITPDTANLAWPQRQLHITPTGIALLRKEQHWRLLQPCDRWVGGVSITPNQPCWHWDQEQQNISYG